MIFLSEVKRLAVDKSSSQKSLAQFFFSLSLLFRKSIEATSDIYATDLTVRELKVPIKTKILPLRSRSNEVIEFLERAEVIKFAGAKTSVDEALEYKKMVIEWMSKLRPDPILTTQKKL